MSDDDPRVVVVAVVVPCVPSVLRVRPFDTSHSHSVRTPYFLASHTVASRRVEE